MYIYREREICRILPVDIMGFCQCKHLTPFLLQDAQCSSGTRSRTASRLCHSAEWMAMQTSDTFEKRTAPQRNLKIAFKCSKEKHPLQFQPFFKFFPPFVGGVNLPQSHDLIVHSTNGFWTQVPI